MEFSLFKKEEAPKVEQKMLDWLDKIQTTNGTLYESMKYSLAAGGKRIRPMLLLAVIQSLNGELKNGYDTAAALEYVHTYSLIHDDLPAMDNDELRRGKPTNHIVFGEAVAILAGDALLTQAFEIIGKSDITLQQKVALTVALAQSSGANGMVAGQVEDIEGEGKTLSLTDLKAVHRKKTGKLIQFAVFAGCTLADAPVNVQELLARFAEHFGLAFQIRDDILDVIGNVEELGKNIGQDEEHSKSTYPHLMTLSGAKEALDNELDDAADILREVKDSYQVENQGIDMTLLNDMVDLLRITNE
ncbi:polyprenyl synthetase family protein [Desemzia sp. RIT804]|uniref:polyprenyl synthetase family protein n=1 Tax=Desemzia sp. RIT 804 TaxID=2810209 RepID=UPI00194F34F3|nr:farnesyl diphosphate synthase [Desemzia sp. RIT 804]MBM6613369.1 polyprenyl synthetase family protein [Desemzia sp. RIT 804]